MLILLGFCLFVCLFSEEEKKFEWLCSSVFFFQEKEKKKFFSSSSTRKDVLISDPKLAEVETYNNLLFFLSLSYEFLWDGLL